MSIFSREEGSGVSWERQPHGETPAHLRPSDFIPKAALPAVRPTYLPSPLPTVPQLHLSSSHPFSSPFAPWVLTPRRPRLPPGAQHWPSGPTPRPQVGTLTGSRGGSGARGDLRPLCPHRAWPRHHMKPAGTPSPEPRVCLCVGDLPHRAPQGVKGSHAVLEQQREGAGVDRGESSRFRADTFI